MGKATRAEASSGGSAAGPRGRGQGPAQRGAPRRERGGRPVSPRSSGSLTGGSVGLGEIGEPRLPALGRSGTQMPAGWDAP